MAITLVWPDHGDDLTEADKQPLRRRESALECLPKL
jgi:hypothetical protein